MKIFLKILNTIDYALRIILALLSICIFALAAFGIFGKQLCENDSTCYALIAFLGGVIITLKIKILDSKNNLKELIVFIAGILVNITFILIGFFLGCNPNPDYANHSLVILNATIWLDFIILIRSLYIIIVIYSKSLFIPWKEKNDKSKAKSNDLFNFWLKKEKNKTVIRALTDESFKKIEPSLKTEETNLSLATYGSSIIKMCLSKLLLDKVNKPTKEKAKYESDEYLVKHVAKHYSLITYIRKDSNNTKIPNNYDYIVKRGNNPHKYIATAVEAMVAAIYIEANDLDAIIKLVDSWRTL